MWISLLRLLVLWLKVVGYGLIWLNVVEGFKGLMVVAVNCGDVVVFTQGAQGSQRGFEKGLGFEV